MSISRTLLATAAGVLVASSSYAADMMYDKAPTIAPPAPIFYDWSGVYVGLHAGYFWGDVDSLANPGATVFSYDVNGFLGGAQIGANWQFDRFVLGIEGDLSLSGADGGTLAGPAATPVNSEIDWFGTVRARAGIAIDRVLIYGTGGVAFADMEQSVAGAGSDDQTRTGWTAGVGVEAAITENLSAKVEYLYADFGEESYAFVPGAVLNSELSGSFIRAGLNYRFNLF